MRPRAYIFLTATRMIGIVGSREMSCSIHMWDSLLCLSYTHVVTEVTVSSEELNYVIVYLTVLALDPGRQLSVFLGYRRPIVFASTARHKLASVFAQPDHPRISFHK